MSCRVSYIFFFWGPLRTYISTVAVYINERCLIYFFFFCFFVWRATEHVTFDKRKCSLRILAPKPPLSLSLGQKSANRNEKLWRKSSDASDDPGAQCRQLALCVMHANCKVFTARCGSQGFYILPVEPWRVCTSTLCRVTAPHRARLYVVAGATTTI